MSHSTCPLLCIPTKHASDLDFVQVDFLTWWPCLMTSWLGYSDTFPVMLLFYINKLAFLVYISRFWGKCLGPKDQTQGGCTELQLLREGWEPLVLIFCCIGVAGHEGERPGWKLIGEFLTQCCEVSSGLKHCQRLTHSLEKKPQGGEWPPEGENKGELRFISYQINLRWLALGYFPQAELGQRAIQLSQQSAGWEVWPLIPCFPGEVIY